MPITLASELQGGVLVPNAFYVLDSFDVSIEPPSLTVFYTGWKDAAARTAHVNAKTARDVAQVAFNDAQDVLDAVDMDDPVAVEAANVALAAANDVLTAAQGALADEEPTELDLQASLTLPGDLSSGNIDIVTAVVTGGVVS